MDNPRITWDSSGNKIRQQNTKFASISIQVSFFFSDFQGWEIRYSVKVSRNKTHLTSTMTLKYTRPTDTGLYTCAGAFTEREKRNRFVYVSS